MQSLIGLGSHEYVPLTQLLLPQIQHIYFSDVREPIAKKTYVAVAVEHSVPRISMLHEHAVHDRDEYIGEILRK